MATLLSNFQALYLDKSDEEKEESVKTNLEFLNQTHGVVSPIGTLEMSSQEQNQYAAIGQMFLAVIFLLPEHKAAKYYESTRQVIGNLNAILRTQSSELTETLANMHGLKEEIIKHENKLRTFLATGIFNFRGKRIDIQMTDKEEVAELVSSLRGYIEELKFLSGENYDSSVYEPLIPSLGYIGADQEQTVFSVEGPNQKIAFLETIGVIDFVVQKYCSDPNEADPDNPSINPSKAASILCVFTDLKYNTLRGAIRAMYKGKSVKNNPLNGLEIQELIKEWTKKLIRSRCNL